MLFVVESLYAAVEICIQYSPGEICRVSTVFEHFEWTATFLLESV